VPVPERPVRHRGRPAGRPAADDLRPAANPVPRRRDRRSFLAVGLAHTGFGLPLALFLLRNYLGSLPASVFESAAIDGASEMTAFFRLALPMSVPALASLAIFQFLWVWNDLLVALIFLGPNIPNHPMTITLAGLVNSLGGEWHFLTAAAFVQMALPVTVFLLLQRYFASGLLAGAVKG